LLHFALTLLLLGSWGCAGTHAAPVMQVPLFTRAGQTEGGLVFRPASPRNEIGGLVRFAATDQLRVGGSVVGATRRHADAGRSDDAHYPSLFAEGFFGAEWSTLFMRFGGLLGSGYGASELSIARCRSVGADRACAREDDASIRTRYVRSYGQLHFGIAPPGPLAVSLAVRVPFVIDLERERSRESHVSTEVGFTHSLILRYVRLDLQPMWSRAQGFTLNLALLLRMGGRRR
jgi:hypothetical protein